MPELNPKEPERIASLYPIRVPLTEFIWGNVRDALIFVVGSRLLPVGGGGLRLRSILRVQDGRITDNWHLEDNLTFLRQVGLLPNP